MNDKFFERVFSFPPSSYDYYVKIGDKYLRPKKKLGDEPYYFGFRKTAKVALKSYMKEFGYLTSASVIRVNLLTGTEECIYEKD